MKRISILLALALLASACGDKAKDGPDANGKSGSTTTADSSSASASASSDVPEGEAPPVKKYFDVESGVIEMKNSLLGGNQTLYFDQYGARQAIYSELNMMGNKMKTVQITKGGYVFSFNPDSKSGFKQKLNPESLTAPTDPSELSDAQKKQYQYQDLDAKTILGKETKGYSMTMNGTMVKAWTWNKIPLYMEMSSAATKEPIRIEATKLDTDAEVSADRFVVPTDVKLNEQPATSMTPVPNSSAPPANAPAPSTPSTPGTPSPAPTTPGGK